MTSSCVSRSLVLPNLSESQPSVERVTLNEEVLLVLYQPSTSRRDPFADRAAILLRRRPFALREERASNLAYFKDDCTLKSWTSRVGIMRTI